jgi:hypothetical protein
MKEYIFKGTPAPWSVPHICQENVECNCGYVLSESYMGSVCDIRYSLPDADWRQGDHAPLEEAIANGKLIAKAPDMLALLIKFAKNTNMFKTENEELLKSILE